MLSASMSYGDFRDSELVRGTRLEDEFNVFATDTRVFHTGSVDETPEIASEVTVGKEIDLAVIKKQPRSPKLYHTTSSKASLVSNPTWSSWARQQRGRRRSSSSPSVAGSGRKKFICEKCNDVFNRSSDLRLHRDTMHAGEKKYKCKDCGKLFSQKGSLNRHMAQVPHGEFKYRCPRCGRIFVYKEYLMTHLKFSINCVKNHTPDEFPSSVIHANSYLSSVNDSGANGGNGESTSYYKHSYSSSPGTSSSSPSMIPRNRLYSKPPPGLRIPLT